MRVLVLVLLLAAACGNPQDKDGSHKGTHQHGGGGHVDPRFVAVQPVIARACGGCHNGEEERVIDSPARLKGAQSRIESGNMPPGGVLDLVDRAALLSF
jgi:hypothetical protein